MDRGAGPPRYAGPPMGTYLAEIVAAHRDAAAADQRDVDELCRLALGAPEPRGLVDALRRRSASGLAVIAEIKRRSPSAGPIAPDLDPAAVARAYTEGGACALSVLTDAAYFGGSADDLRRAREAVGVPVLRKDFTVSAADVCDARLMGADAVLLIVAALAAAELAELYALAGRLSLDVIVEVHDEGELERALDLGPQCIGVNQRDLSTFTVDAKRAERLAALLPAEVLGVAESGIKGSDDARRLAAAGYQAVLVGQSVVENHDQQGAVAALVGHRIGHLGVAP
jgi:indole-3-glycerol phosphate synthase